MSKRQHSSPSKQTGRSRSAPKTATRASTATPTSTEAAPLSTSSILQLQQTVGNQAVQRALGGGALPPANGAGIVQRKPAPGKLNHTTHLIKMSGRSLLNGEQQQRVYPNDVLVLDDRDKVWSRRGVDGERRREFHRDESDTDYKYFRVLKHNNNDVRGERLYVRYTTFDFMSAAEDVETSVAEAERQNVLREMLRDTDEVILGNIRLGRETQRLLTRFADIIDGVREDEGDDKAAFEESLGQAMDQLETEHIGGAKEIRHAARDERYKPAPQPEAVTELHNRAYRNRRDILSALANIELNTAQLGSRALRDQDAEDEEAAEQATLWRELLALGDEAYELRTEGTTEAEERISSLSSSAKEKFNTIYGYFGNLWDMFGIVAASVPVLAGITALSAVIATVGMAIGIIAAELGAAFAFISHKREKALAGTQQKLEQQEFSEDLQHIAEYAKQQKNKKKKRQAAVAVGGLAVAVMAGVGLVGGPVAIVMAVLGAAVGIGFILYKWYRKKKGKKRAMEALVKGAVDNDDPDSKEALSKLGISESEITDAAGDAGARGALESKVEQKLKDQRVDTANKLVSYVKRGKPSEKVGAEAILLNLGVDPGKVRGEYTEEKAISKVAGKLASW